MRLNAKIAERQKTTVAIKTEYIKLDSLLKFSGIAESGSFAKMLIGDGKVKVNGEKCFARGKKIRNSDIVSYKNIDLTVINEN